MFIVTVNHHDIKWYLRWVRGYRRYFTDISWTQYLDWADKFNSEELAQEALEASKKFIQPTLRLLIKIEEHK